MVTDTPDEGDAAPPPNDLSAWLAQRRPFESGPAARPEFEPLPPEPAGLVYPADPGPGWEWYSLHPAEWTRSAEATGAFLASTPIGVAVGVIIGPLAAAVTLFSLAALIYLAVEAYNDYRTRPRLRRTAT